jgi:DNA primase
VIPPVDFADIKRLVAIADVLRIKGYNRRQQRGRTDLYPCPLHSLPTSASRAFRTRDGLWVCARCGDGGDVIRLWARLHGLSDLHAALDLCAVFELQVPRK